MARDKINVDDVGKTVTIAALLNTVLAPLYWADAKIGLSAALVATGAFYMVRMRLVKRRPAANGINSLNTFLVVPQVIRVQKFKMLWRILLLEEKLYLMKFSQILTNLAIVDH